MSHSHGQTTQIYRSDGTLHPGPRTDWGLWNLATYPLAPGGAWNLPPASGPGTGISFGNCFIQLGTTWRIGSVDDNHCSMSHSGGQTVQIYRSDGTLHPGPRTDWGVWHLPLYASPPPPSPPEAGGIVSPPAPPQNDGCFPEGCFGGQRP
jgi:hypothetical protein